MSKTKVRRINHNPRAADVWLAEKGAPWRADYEFMQLQLDDKAKEEVFQKRILNMAKSVAGGIEEQFGRQFDWAQLQHNLRDAYLLAREDLPIAFKPKVTKERAIWLRKLKIACQAFDIPKVVQLMDISLPVVYNTNMTHTALNLYQAQKKKLSKPVNSLTYRNSIRDDLKRLTSVKIEPIREAQAAQTRRTRALESLQRAFRFHMKIHGRSMLKIRDFFVEECGGSDSMTRENFATAMYKLGFGMSQKDVAEVLHAIDPMAKDRIDYDAVLFFCRVGTEIKLADVPDRPTPKQRRGTGGKENRWETVQLL